jgi:hypothetical protein
MRHDLTAREVLDAGTARIERELASEARARAPARIGRQCVSAHE